MPGQRLSSLEPCTKCKLGSRTDYLSVRGRPNGGKGVVLLTVAHGAERPELITHHDGPPSRLERESYERLAHESIARVAGRAGLKDRYRLAYGAILTTTVLTTVAAALSVLVTPSSSLLVSLGFLAGGVSASLSGVLIGSQLSRRRRRERSVLLQELLAARPESREQTPSSDESSAA